MSIQCDKCDAYTHFGCAKLTPLLVDRIINYFCDKCRDEKHNTWDGTEVNEAEMTEKKGGYFGSSRV